MLMVVVAVVTANSKGANNLKNSKTKKKNPGDVHYMARDSITKMLKIKLYEKIDLKYYLHFIVNCCLYDYLRSLCLRECL